MKNYNDIFNLVTGNLVHEEKLKVISEINSKKENKEIFRKVKIAWAFLCSDKNLNVYDEENLYLKIKNEISGKKRKLYPTLRVFLKYAAIIVFIISLTTIYFTNRKQLNGIITPENKLYTSFITENGQRSKVVLPDSSIVWLNSGTTLKYPSDFFSKNRNIFISGQAFFEVTKNKEIPFIVSNNNLEIKVLGTKFDVEAYPDDERIKVTLKTGQVELLNIKEDNFNYKLNPGQMASFNKVTSEVDINNVNVQNATSWVDGVLTFSETPMKSVLQKLERWLNVEIVVQDEEVYNTIFTATIQNQSLEEILESIKFSCVVNYKVVEGTKKSKTKIILSK